MLYCTEADLVEQFGGQVIELTDRVGAGVVDTAVLDPAIADASALIDSYLQKQYALPLAQAQIDASPIKRYCGDIVRYFLMIEGADENATERFRNAERWLRAVGNGNASLGSQDASATPIGRVATAPAISGHDWEAF